MSPLYHSSDRISVKTFIWISPYEIYINIKDFLGREKNVGPISIKTTQKYF